MKGWIFKEQLWIPAWKYPVSKIIDGVTFHWIKYWLITKPRRHNARNKYLSQTPKRGDQDWITPNWRGYSSVTYSVHKLHQFSRRWKESHSSFSVVSFYILKNENVWTTIYEWHERLHFSTKNWLSSPTVPRIVFFVQ